MIMRAYDAHCSPVELFVLVLFRSTLLGGVSAHCVYDVGNYGARGRRTRRVWKVDPPLMVASRRMHRDLPFFSPPPSRPSRHLSVRNTWDN